MTNKKDLVFATGNAHKVLEVNQILKESTFVAIPMSEKRVHEDIPETGETMEENAWLKADYLNAKLGVDCFAEDSGLEITALNMDPGIYTARYAGPQRSHDDNMDKVLENLKGKEDRSAQFRAVVALIVEGERKSFEGIVKGQIATGRRGTGGFGYDPIFIPAGYEETFAQLPDEVKNTISHRARAIEAMTNYLNKKDAKVPSIISVDWLKENLNLDNLVIIDASTSTVNGNASEYSNQYLPNAIKANLKADFVDTESSLPNTFPDLQTSQQAIRNLGINDNSIVVVYDNLGVYSSPRLWYLLKALGHQNVAVLDGGLPAWIKAGYENKAAPEVSEGLGDFQASYNSKWLKTKEEVRNNLATKDFQLIDARSRGRFDATEAEPRAGLRGGHIPDSLSLPYTEVLEDGQYKSESDRKAIWNSLNTDQSVAFTCGSGMTACIDMVAFYDFVDVPMSIFDGSWTEWALDETLPIESSR